eukprot:SAG22_NODE_2732_length_2271_cov_1.730203_1_plen_22_part_10
MLSAIIDGLSAFQVAFMNAKHN